MAWTPAQTPIKEAAPPSGAQLGALALLTLVASLIAAALIRWGGADTGLLVSLPMMALGVTLICWNSHWGLCYAAFAITPLGNVQRELAGVTINLPEFLILALVLKEGLRFLARRERPLEQLPLKAVVLLAACLLVGLATGFLRNNGAIKALQDFRQFIEFLALFCLVCQRVTSRRLTLQIAASYLAGAALIAIHGIVQHVIPIGISETQISSDLVLHNGVRSGSFYGATPLGGLMVLATGLAVGLLLSVERRRGKILLITCICLCLLAMIFTKTRGSWVGAAVALTFLFVWVRPTKKVAIATVATALLLSLVAGPTIIARLSTLADPTDDESLMKRAQYYAAAAHIGRAHPILGLGWGCYYQIEDIAHAGEYVETPRPPDAEDATVHSAYLQIFVKSGAVGLTGFLVFIGFWIERIVRVFKARPHARSDLAFFAGLTAGLVGYLFHSTFEDFFQWPVMSQSFWLLMGLSFVSATALGGSARFPRISLAIISAAVLGFVLFIAACLRLETAHTDYYEENVARALADGDVEKALHVAKHATKVRYKDAKAHTVYAEALLVHGDSEEAMDQLDAAMSVLRRPRAPRWINTGATYYYAPARLIRGRLQAESNNFRAAAAEFELARPYVDLGGAAYSDFHSVMYATYANLDLWERALDFGTPDKTTVDALDSARLAHLARAAESRGAWEFVDATTGRLLQYAEYRAEAYYLLGRMRLALDQPEVARLHFSQAVRDGHPDAPFYLGLALAALNQPTDAEEAFLSTPGASVYHAVALAQAITMDPEFDGEKAAATTTRAQLFAALTAMTPIPPDEDSAAAPAAFHLGRLGGGATPLTLLWGSVPTGPESISGITSIPAPPGQWAYKLGATGPVLQFQWAESLVLDPALLNSGSQPGSIPGWIDGMHDWFELRPPYSASAKRSPSGVSELDVPGLAWFYSVPASAGPSRGCLLAGAVAAPENVARILGQSIDASSNVLETRAVAQSNADGETASGVAYFSPADEVSGVRFQLEVARKVVARFENLRLLAVLPPPAP